MDDQTASIYKKYAKTITNKLKQNLIDTVDHGAGDPFWRLEVAIAEAMRTAAEMEAERARSQVVALIADFDADDGTSQS